MIGCGTIGLTAARQLQRRGFDVTIYAQSVPPATTSNMALAAFTPTSGPVDNDQRTPLWDAQFRRAAEIGYRQLQLLVGRQYGVSWIYSYSLMNDIRQRVGPGGSSLLPPDVRIGGVVLQPGEHPFPSTYTSRRPLLRIEPSIYLDALVRDVLFFGGRIVIRKFDEPRDFMALDESLIVNCTGSGSRALFGDEELIPVKGQLTVLVPQAEVNYATFGAIPGSAAAQSGFVHMMPRSDGIVLGGTTERGVWDLAPNEDARRRIVDAHIELFAAMRAPEMAARAPNHETPAAVPSLESFFDLAS